MLSRRFNYFLLVVWTCLTEAFYYQIPTPLLRVNKVQIQNTRLVLFKSGEEWRWLPDECPHMGASLSRGWVGEQKIFCPYHGFGFVGDKDRLLQVDRDFYFFDGLWTECSKIEPFYPPEHKDPEFAWSGGSMEIQKSQPIVTENVLDMLHISYVHSFGNLADPLPQKIRYEPIDDVSGRTIFVYRPFEWTISNKMGEVKEVIVENEFHLPTTTITRVKAGNLVKTVLTRSTPLSETKTLFFYRVYRNFWKSERVPFLTVMGDFVMDFLMKKTLKEDIDILEKVYHDRGKGFLTPYDITIDHYRKSLTIFNENNK